MEQLATIAGQQPEHPPRAQVDRQLQAARGDARRASPVTLRDARMYEFLDRLIVDRDPADPRLPRPQPALVRRPRQLLDRRARADHLPRDRLRRDRPGPRPRRDDHHHRRHRRGGASRCSRRSACRSPGGPPRRQDAEARGGGRGEAQGGGARRAEAEQAALEQLKEENPEAYAKPASPRRARRARDEDEGSPHGHRATVEES